MARARNIKPGTMENEELAECSVQARLLFIYTWMLADREGRMEDRPKRIAAKAMPYDNIDADALLQELHDKGFLLRYEVGGVKYIQILTFQEHQSPHVKEKESTIPAPDLSDTSTGQLAGLSGEPLEQEPPDSLKEDSLKEDSNKPQPPDSGRLFESFWRECLAAYKKVDCSPGTKKKALAQFKKLKPDMTRTIELSNTLHAQAANKMQRRGAGLFTPSFPHVERWLRDEHWAMEITPVMVEAASNVQPIRQRQAFPL